MKEIIYKGKVHLIRPKVNDYYSVTLKIRNEESKDVTYFDFLCSEELNTNDVFEIKINKVEKG